MFHHEFASTNSDMTVHNQKHGTPITQPIYCNTDKYIPVWTTVAKNEPLPPCVFVPAYCNEDHLKTIVNGEAMFIPGHQELKTREVEGTKTTPHSAIIECNGDGFFMMEFDKIWRGTMNSITTPRHNLTGGLSITSNIPQVSPKSCNNL